MLTISQYAKRAGFTRQHIHNLLIRKRIKGARKVKAPGMRGGFVWMIPRSAKIA